MIRDMFCSVFLINTTIAVRPDAVTMKFIFQWLRSKLLPSWMLDKTPDINHFYRRIYTKDYQHKKYRLRIYWFVFAILLSQINSPPLTVILLLLAAFLTFAVLDEGPS